MKTKLELAYYGQWQMAKKRNIDWNFTFETWLQWWEQTGRLEQRGRCKGNYVMARHNDVGPYSPENISCITVEENHRHLGVDATKRRLQGTINSLSVPVVRTAEYREKISKTMSGRTLSDEHRKNISESRRRYELNKQLARTHSPT